MNLRPDGDKTVDSRARRTLRVLRWQRRAEVLTRPKLPCLAEFHTVNLTAGCPNECRYCYAQSYAHHPGWGKVAFYANAKDKLKEELARTRGGVGSAKESLPDMEQAEACTLTSSEYRLQPVSSSASASRDRRQSSPAVGPRLVYFSTACEPFVPAPRVLDDLYEIMAALLDAGAALVISTKGVVPERFVALFARYPGKVCVQVGITTLDDDARRLIEPRAASVAERLDNLARLIGNSGTGSGTQRSEDCPTPNSGDRHSARSAAPLSQSPNSIEARIDPLVPGLTDTDASLAALLSELARIGVRQAVLSYLFLRWGIKFPNDLALGGWSSRAMRKLYTHKVTNYCGGGTIYLPSTEYRAEQFATIGAMAATCGIGVRICRCKNADIPKAVCCHPTDSLVGSGAEPVEGVGSAGAAEPTPPPAGRQLTLF